MIYMLNMLLRRRSNQRAMVAMRIYRNDALSSHAAVNNVFSIMVCGIGIRGPS